MTHKLLFGTDYPFADARGVDRGRCGTSTTSSAPAACRRSRSRRWRKSSSATRSGCWESIVTGRGPEDSPR